MDMFNQSSPAPYSPGAVALQNAFVNRVFGWMTAGLEIGRASCRERVC